MAWSWARGWWMGAAVLATCASCAGTEQPIFLPIAPDVPEGPGVTAPAPTTEPDAGVSMRVDPPPRITILPPFDPGLDEDDAGVEIDPGLNPDASFTWTETLPGTGACGSGVYVGGFECTMPAFAGLPAETISGEVVITLSGSAEEQMLSVDAGTILGAFFTASISSGSLDCTSDLFHAFSIDGVAVLSDSGTFTAVFDGIFDDQSLGIEGAVSMINDLGQTCDGSFRMGIAP